MPLPSRARRKPSRYSEQGEAGEERVATQLLEALGHHGIDARLVGTVAGPRVTRYEIQLAPGTSEARRRDGAIAQQHDYRMTHPPGPGRAAEGADGG